MTSNLYITPGMLYLVRDSSQHVLQAPAYQYVVSNDEHVFYSGIHRVGVRGTDIAELHLGGVQQPVYTGEATAELIAAYLYANPLPA